MDTNGAQESGIGRRLRAARQRLGWSREALAFHSGISFSAIAQVEAGRRRHLRPSTLLGLADALRVTLDYLVSGRGASATMFEHRALLYDTEVGFLEVAAPFLAEATERSEAALAVTTEANIELLRDELGASAERVTFAERSSWYRTPMSALSAYTAFRDAHIDARTPWLRIVGEPLWAGRSSAEVRLWTRYESLLNLAFGDSPLTVLCPYDTRVLDPEIVSSARVTHPHTIEHATLSSSPEYADPGMFVLEG